MSFRKILVMLLVVYSANFVWEMAQAKWFSSMQGLDFWYATWLCARAAGADVVITVVIAGIVALLFRDWQWFLDRRIAGGAVLFVGLALIVTAAIEWWALETGRWTYDERMITILGVGIAPLLQWTLIPLSVLAIARVVYRA